MARYYLAIAALLALVAVAIAHEPLTDGPTKAPRYSTWRKALVIPTNQVSLSARRYNSCAAPYFWLKYTGKKGDDLMLSAGTSGAAGNNAVRVSVAVFGPGLPRRTKKFNFATPRTAGALVVEGAKDVRTCKWLPKEEQSGNKVVTIGGQKRCGLLVANVTTSFFPLLYNPWKLPASGTYYFAFYTQGRYTGRYYIGTGSVKHIHAPSVKLPTPPKGNAGSTNAFWDRRRATTSCCVKGRTLRNCPTRKIYA